MDLQTNDYNYNTHAGSVKKKQENLSHKMSQLQLLNFVHSSCSW